MTVRCRPQTPGEVRSAGGMAVLSPDREVTPSFFLIFEWHEEEGFCLLRGGDLDGANG
jgi:hypothetical protein